MADAVQVALEADQARLEASAVGVEDGGVVLSSAAARHRRTSSSDRSTARSSAMSRACCSLIGGVPAIAGLVDECRTEQPEAVVVADRFARQPGPPRDGARAQQPARSSMPVNVRACPGVTASLRQRAAPAGADLDADIES